MVGVTPEDLEMAYKLVTTSPGYLSKWTKQDLICAAVALRLFVRELPGGPKLLRRAADLASSAPGEEDERMNHAVKAIGHQGGVDASLYRLPLERDGPPTPTTSTQSPDETDPSWDDLSQIPPYQVGASTASGAGQRNVGEAIVEEDEDETLIKERKGEESSPSGAPSANLSNAAAPSTDSIGNHSSSSNGRNGTLDGKVSDFSSNSVRSHAAPPKQLAKAGAVGDGLVDKDANGSGVARVGGGEGVDAVKHGVKGGRKDHATNKKTLKNSDSYVTNPEWRPRVCNQVWRGGTCKNRTTGCKYAHPTPCSNSSCASGPTSGCRAFHPRGRERGKGNGKGGARKGNAVPNQSRKRTNGPHRPNNTAKILKGSSGSSSSSNNAHSRLQERVEMMERQLGLQARAEDKEGKLSYRDVVVRGQAATGGYGSTISNPPSGLRANKEGNGGFGPVQPDPAMLSTVVAAVMAVLAGGNRHF